MSKQIAVRLPDDLVAFVDSAVADGRGASRAAVVTGALERERPVVVLTRELARPHLTSVTVAPITSTVQGLSTEVLVDRRNGLDRASVISCDNVTTIPVERLGAQIGLLLDSQEPALSAAIQAAFDLD